MYEPYHTVSGPWQTDKQSRVPLGLEPLPVTLLLPELQSTAVLDSRRSTNLL